MQNAKHLTYFDLARRSKRSRDGPSFDINDDNDLTTMMKQPRPVLVEHTENKRHIDGSDTSLTTTSSKTTTAASQDLVAPLATTLPRMVRRVTSQCLQWQRTISGNNDYHQTVTKPSYQPEHTLNQVIRLLDTVEENADQAATSVSARISMGIVEPFLLLMLSFVRISMAK